jgi:ribosomal protein RSM22 (predicted rRNA methylase)
MSVDLPSDLDTALTALTEGRSRGAIARRSAELSRTYRAGRRTAEAVRGDDDALAYALVRLPATYAATSAALAAVTDALPDFTPRTLIDAGAGPGTASWAAAAHFADLGDIRLVDENPHLRALALGALQTSSVPAHRQATYDLGDIFAVARSGASADLVIASYVIGELTPDHLARLGEALWSAAAAMLVVVEPGTPAGFSRIRALRAHLIAQGAHVVAPCPHDRACPIVDPDWCHFAQRLNRSRAHRQIKGADLSYEDEKFSYVALARERPPGIGARVLAHPRVGKAEVSAKLCTDEGIVIATAPRRAPEQYKAQKGWRWGDAVDWHPGPDGQRNENS